MSEPATKHDLSELKSEMHDLGNSLRGEMHDLRGEMHELRNGLRGEMHELRNDLHGEMHGMEKRLSWEIAHSINAVAEMLRDQVGIVDEKYADLPERVRRIEKRDRDQPE